MAKQQFEIASIDDFDDSAIVQLPSQEGSNKAVRLRKPDFVQLFADGEAPDLLSSVALAQLNNANGKEPNITINKDNLPDLLQTLNLLCKVCFVEPKIGHGEGELPIERISFNDRMFVFQWALGAEYEPARRFPDETRKNVGTVQSGNGIPKKTK